MIAQHFMFAMRIRARYQMSLTTAKWCNTDVFRNVLTRNHCERTAVYCYARSTSSTSSRNISAMCMCKNNRGIPLHPSAHSTDALLSTVKLSNKCRYSSGQKSDATAIAFEETQSLGDDDHVDAVEIAKSVIIEGSQKDKMILSIPLKRVEVLVHFLICEGFPPDQIKQLLGEKPEFLKSSNRLKNVLPLLKAHNFELKQVFQIVMALPDLSFINESQIDSLFASFSAIDINDLTLCELVTSDPGLLYLDSRAVATRVSELKMYFTKADVTRLVLRTPAVLQCDWNDIQAKFSYVHDVMNVSQRQIVYTRLFSYSLFHVKCRHMFLARAGLFVGTKKARESNPMLQDIIDSSDFQFAKQFGEMHVDEYRTFCKLLAKSGREVFENEDEDEEASS